jgi:hypothetical protein
MEDPTLTFTRGPARRPIARAGDPLLQWATGLPTSARALYAGWLAECGRHADLDDAMQAAGYETVTIKHGGGNLVTHWAIEEADLFILADGVQSLGECKHTPDRYGIAFAWRTLPDGRQQSVLRARVLLRPLLEVGYTAPLLLSVKSTITGDVIAALMRQYDVLDAAEAEQRDAGRPVRPLPFYAFSIVLGAGESVQRGSKGAQKEIAPPVDRVPERIDRAYLLARYIQKQWVAGVERLVAATVPWSIAASADIAAGEGEDTSDH